MEAQTIIMVLSSFGGCGVTAAVFVWFFNSQLKNFTDVALSDQAIKQINKDITEVKAKAEKIETNYNTKFADQKAHMTAEVDRVVYAFDKLAEKIDVQQETVNQIQLTCASNHGIRT